MTTVVRCKLVHYAALDGGAVLGFHGGTQINSPLGVAVGQNLDGLNLLLSLASAAAFSLFCSGCCGCNTLLKFLHLLALNLLECAHTLHHTVPVNFMTVKLRTVYAYELGLAAYAYTAGTAHTGTVNHDGVE